MVLEVSWRLEVEAVSFHELLLNRLANRGVELEEVASEIPSAEVSKICIKVELSEKYLFYVNRLSSYWESGFMIYMWRELWWRFQLIRRVIRKIRIDISMCLNWWCWARRKARRNLFQSWQSNYTKLQFKKLSLEVQETFLQLSIRIFDLQSRPGELVVSHFERGAFAERFRVRLFRR